MLTDCLTAHTISGHDPPVKRAPNQRVGLTG
jgi:hypothetical protein